MKHVNVWVGAGALLLVSATVLWLHQAGRAEHPAYRTVPVRRGHLKAMVASTGRLAPLNTVEVGSQVSGTIQQLFVDYNAEVKKDQILARIDPALYAGQVHQAEAQLQEAELEHLQLQNALPIAEAALHNAEAQCFSARAALADATRTYNRLNTLAERRTVAGADRDTALARRDQAEGGVKMAEAQIESARAQLKRAEAQEKNALANITEKRVSLDMAKIKLDYCTIRSPIDGVVIARNVDQGQTVAATLQSPVFFTIAEDLASMQVEVDVSEADVGRIRTGQTVEFNVDAFQDKNFVGTVRQIRNSATSINNVVTYKVIADVDNAQLLLRPGMTANAAIVVSEVKEVLLVPNAALRFKPDDASPASKDRSLRPVQESGLYKKAVSVLELNRRQSDALAEILERGRQQLKNAYAVREEGGDLQPAWHAYFTQVLTGLAQILEPNQLAKFKTFRQHVIEAARNRAQGRQRRARIYVLREHGPEAVEAAIGITDDTETQLVGDELAEGDRVIVGKALAEAAAKSAGSFLANLKPKE